MPYPYKALAICFDGTWNTWESRTNVSKIYREIADLSSTSSTQRKFYDEGVGTAWYDRFRGGMLGFGLDRNIRQGYAWLATMLECETDQNAPAPVAGDERKANGDRKDKPAHSSGVEFLASSDLYVFGFSRGAYTARSLCGLINLLGIPFLRLDRKDESPLDHPLVKRAWELYANRPLAETRSAYEKGELDADARKKYEAHMQEVADFRKLSRYPVRIHFLGVWDTVGALGIPRIFDQPWLWRPSSKHRFHDTRLCESVRNAFHAVAIDEHRAAYTTTLWTAPTPATVEMVEQRWFPGAHADVGGGYPDDLLHSLPLEWLARRAAGCGLQFVNDRGLMQGNEVPSAVAVSPAVFDLDGTEHMSPVHDSYAEFMGGAYRDMRAIGMQGRVYRRMLVDADGVCQTVDPSAFLKWKVDPSYRPPNLGQAGREDVAFARAQWEAATVNG